MRKLTIKEADSVFRVLENNQKSCDVLAAFLGVHPRTLRQVLHRQKEASESYLSHLFLAVGLKKPFVDAPAPSGGENAAEQVRNAPRATKPTTTNGPTMAEIEANLAALRAANPRPVDRRLCGIAPEPEPPAPEPLDPEDFFRKF